MQFNNYDSEELASMGILAHRSAAVHRSVLFFGNGPIYLGELCRIDAYTIITGNVTIGKRVHIGVQCYLNGACKIQIEDYSGLSAGSKIYTCSDDYTEGHMAGPQFPPHMRKPHSAGVTIGVAAIVGSSAVVLPGVEVGEGAMVGALSLVKKSVPSYEVWGGVPAKRIGERQCIRTKKYLEELRSLQSSL